MKRFGIESLVLAGAAAVVLAARAFGPSSGPEPWSLTIVLSGAAVLASLLAVGETLRARRQQGDASGLALLAGTFVTAALTFVAGGSVPKWRFPLPEVGIVLGPMLLAALAGTLLLLADRWTAGVSRLAPVVGRRSLLLGAGLGAIATALLVQEGALGTGRPLWLAVAAVFAGTVLLAGGSAVLLLREDAKGDSGETERGAARHSLWAAALGAAALLGVGAEAWAREGTYWAGPTRAMLVAILVGLAAAQRTELPLLRRIGFAVVLFSALLAR